VSLPARPRSPTLARDQNLQEETTTEGLGTLHSLYAEVAAHALAVALRIVGRLDEAEDVVQETFVDAWRTRDRFDVRRGSPTAWILNIARSRALDRLRKDGNRSRFEREAAVQAPSALELNDPTARAQLDAVLGQLTLPQQQVLQLAYFDGLTQREISLRIHMPLGTVKTHARRGLERLAELMRE
jgi:RNA polymerase sigma-70 factor (ECF subfamily)